MSNHLFSKIEDRFFRLKGQLEAGRITRDQFNAAAKELILRDAQGRYWALGLETGKWYVHDGIQWAESPPPRGETEQLPPRPTAGSWTAPPPPGTWSAPALPARGSNMPVILSILGVATVLLLCVALALLWVRAQGGVNISLGAPTDTSLPVIAPIQSPAMVNPPSPTLIPPSPVVIVVTATPPPTAVTATPPPTVASPTTPPIPTPMLWPTSRPLTSTPMQPTATPIPPTLAIPTIEPLTPTPSLPPGVYVTGVSTDPSQVKAGQPPTFNVTFVNSLGVNADYNWYIKIYEPGKKQSFGETAKSAGHMAPGESVLATFANWKPAGGTPCRQYIARVFYIAPDNATIEFPKPGGETHMHYFQVCD